MEDPEVVKCWSLFDMRLKLAGIAIVVFALTATSLAFAQQYTLDRKTSDALTVYLRNEHLPLVGGQVMIDAAGDRRLVLYGFVATKFGKEDARNKALHFLGTSKIEVDNRIDVRPEIAKLRAPAGGRVKEPAAASSPETLDQILNDIQRYGIEPAPGQGSGGLPR